MRAFRTGDMGFMAEGVLTLCGRVDLQVQIKGAACPDNAITTIISFAHWSDVDCVRTPHQ